MCKKISIITVTYNSESTVEQTIESVLKQTYSNFEYIIVDGASTDNTLNIIRKYAGIDNRIKYITEPDRGIYDAMNKGIKMSTGDIVALLNSDDYYEINALEKITNYIQQENMFVIYGMVRFLENEKEDRIIFYNHNSLPKRMIMHPACFVSSNIYKKYQYDISYKSAADYDLFLKLYNNNEVEFIPVYEVITNFRTGGMSSTVISDQETNDIKFKFGYIGKKEYLIRKIALIVKKIFL